MCEFNVVLPNSSDLLHKRFIDRLISEVAGHEDPSLHVDHSRLDYQSGDMTYNQYDMSYQHMAGRYGVQDKPFTPTYHHSYQPHVQAQDSTTAQVEPSLLVPTPERHPDFHLGSTRRDDGQPGPDFSRAMPIPTTPKQVATRKFSRPLQSPDQVPTLSGSAAGADQILSQSWHMGIRGVPMIRANNKHVEEWLLSDAQETHAADARYLPFNFSDGRNQILLLQKAPPTDGEMGIAPPPLMSPFSYDHDSNAGMDINGDQLMYAPFNFSHGDTSDQSSSAEVAPVHSDHRSQFAKQNDDHGPPTPFSNQSFIAHDKHGLDLADGSSVVQAGDTAFFELTPSHNGPSGTMWQATSDEQAALQFPTLAHNTSTMTNEEIMEDHFTDVHIAGEDKTKKKCTECQKSYSDRKGAVRHFRDKHLNEKPYFCEYCGCPPFSRQDHLSRHQKSRKHLRNAHKIIRLC